MGQYKLYIKFYLFQLAIGFKYEKNFNIEIYLPFTIIIIGLMHCAKGAYVYKRKDR
jgi:hypothetical protein